MKNFRILIVVLLFPIQSMAGVCDTAWDGDKVVTAIGSRPAYMRVPLRNQQQQITEVTVGQIQAFNDAKSRISGVAGLSPTFLICGDSQPNAFAIKGSSGDVVGVTIGMLKLVDGDADMAAAVIGHEFAHHTHNHSEVGAARDAVIGLAGLILGMVVDAKSQRRTGVPTNVGQTFGGIGATLVSRKFSRDQEREADSTGFQYMVTTGFNPNGAIRLADKMNQGGAGSIGLFFDSHPGWDERRQLFQTMIAGNPQAQQIIARSSVLAPTPTPPSSQASSTSTQTLALAPTYTTTDAQKSFTAGLVAYRSGDIVNGVREFRSAAEAGHAGAQAAVGYLYSVGRGGLPKDDVEAVRLYRLAVDQGHALGQNNLGVMYTSGRGGLPKDEVEAVRLYRLAADQGNANAQANLGGMYEAGRGGLTKDDAEAVRLYQLAVNQGNAQGQVSVGFHYASGRGGLPKDEIEAVRLFRLAAGQGNALGQANLGFMYSRGAGGLPKDDVEAVRLYRLAADQGNALGQVNLAAKYAQGQGGLPKDSVQAVNLFRLAANQGFAQGQAALGIAYENGIGGLGKDVETAVTWYRLAANQGSPQAIAALKRLGRE